MVASWRGLVVVGAMVVATACGSSAKTGANGTATTTPTVPGSASGDVLVFREVLGTIPYGSANGSPVSASSVPPASAGPSSCDGGRRVTSPAEQTAAASVVLADSKRELCYLLGPTLVTGHNVSTADAVFDDMISEWAVNVHFATDDFLQKVASVEVGKEIAIVVAGVLQSVPTINPGITGRDVEIAGSFDDDEAAARRIAAIIDPSSASRTPTTPTTTIIDVFDKRCNAVGPRLGFGPIVGTSTVTAEMARSALKRAHQAVPALLANLDGRETLALCEFTPNTPNAGGTPTTVCPNGDIAEVGEAPPLIMYAVDANLTTIKLPGMQYLLPPGVTFPPPPGPCPDLPSP